MRLCLPALIVLSFLTWTPSANAQWPNGQPVQFRVVTYIPPTPVTYTLPVRYVYSTPVYYSAPVYYPAPAYAAPVPVYAAPAPRSYPTPVRSFFFGRGSGGG